MKKNTVEYKSHKLKKKKLKIGETVTTYQPETVIDIGYERICKCPPHRLNCLNAKEWIKSQVAVWELYYEKRDIRDKFTHPAVFPIALPKKCIELFTHKGELVIDPFVGSGTTLIAARDLNRNPVEFGLNPEYIEFTKRVIH